MKKIFFALLAFCAVAGSLGAATIEDPSSVAGVAVIKSGSTFKVFYQGEKAGNVRVSIYDANGKAVFRETLRNLENFMRPYNFSSLPFGEYVIEVIDANGARSQKAVHRAATSQRVASLRSIGDDGKLVLTVANKGNDVFKIRIFNDNNKVVYQSTEEVSGDFAKVYKVVGVDGKVSFEITDASGTITTLSN